MSNYDSFDWPSSTQLAIQATGNSLAKETPSSHTPYNGATDLTAPTPIHIFTSLQDAYRIIEKRRLTQQKYRQLKISDFKSALFHEKHQCESLLSCKRKEEPALLEKSSCKPPQRQVLLDEYFHISKI